MFQHDLFEPEDQMNRVYNTYEIENTPHFFQSVLDQSSGQSEAAWTLDLLHC